MKCYNCDEEIVDSKEIKYKSYVFCTIDCLKDFRSAEHINVEKLGKEMYSMMLDSQFENQKKHKNRV